MLMIAAGGLGIISGSQASGPPDTQNSDQSATRFVRHAFVLDGNNVGQVVALNGTERSFTGAGSVDPYAITLGVTVERLSSMYTVQAGDTLTSVAIRFSISSFSIIWNNPDKVRGDQIRAGDQLNIPTIDGILYTLKQGDTFSDVGAYYGIDASSIMSYPPNRLASPDQVPVGATILLPGAVPPPPPPAAPYSPAGFHWPLVGPITAYVGDGRGHTGIDVSGHYGVAIAASAAGRVTFAGAKGDGYGNYVIINHGNGLTTVYAHLSEIHTATGQSVGAGTTIGSLGCSGLCTGPHLHFEIRLNGAAANPLNHLP